jgi:hypothetical protein
MQTPPLYELLPFRIIRTAIRSALILSGSLGAGHAGVVPDLTRRPRMSMRRLRLLLAGALFFAVIVPVSGVTILEVTGAGSGNSWQVGGGSGAMIASWTLTRTYANVSIATFGLSGDVTLYLTTNIGPAATINDVVASGTLGSSAFTGLTLPPNTYYLVVGDPGSGRWLTVVTPTITIGGSVTRNHDLDIAGNVVSSPPYTTPLGYIADFNNLQQYLPLSITGDPVGISDQTISFGSVPDKTFGDPDFDVSATATSALTVTFTVSGNCTISGATVHLKGAGSCTVTAHQAGDAS